MLAHASNMRPFSSPDWLYEVKHDGYRMLAQFGDGEVLLRTRGGHDCSGWFPEVVEALGQMSGGPCIVDGEVCVMDDIGRSNFKRLQDRAYRRRWYKGCDSVVYAIFDLLVDAGQDVMNEPLHARKTRLMRLFTPKPTKTLLILDAIPQYGEELFSMAKALQLEGLIAKKADSIYYPGERTDAWRKIKRRGAVPPGRFKRV
jgi:bifunctional non-homologous end joining protein LigD